MGSFYLILGLVFSLIIAIVALANNEMVSVNYIFGRSEVSLILLILGSAVAGALAMGLFSIFRGIRNALAFREIRHKLGESQKKVKDLEEEKLYLEAELNRAVSVPEEEESSNPETVDSAADTAPAEEGVEEEPL
jgi:lipopolysaccharide assembly protein A